MGWSELFLIKADRLKFNKENQRTRMSSTEQSNLSAACQYPADKLHGYFLEQKCVNSDFWFLCSTSNDLGLLSVARTVLLKINEEIQCSRISLIKQCNLSAACQYPADKLHDCLFNRIWFILTANCNVLLWIIWIAVRDKSNYFEDQKRNPAEPHVVNKVMQLICGASVSGQWVALLFF